MPDLKLTVENYEMLNENFLYECSPVVDNSFSVGTTPGTYHCKNWTFRVSKESGRAWVSDTYFNSTSEELTDDNIGKYKNVFDFREVIRVPDSSIDEYDQEDLFRVAIDSGGYSCGNLHWKKKTTNKSRRLLIEKKNSQIASHKRSIGWLEDDLHRINNNKWYEALK
jgi:hypothetical protein